MFGNQKALKRSTREQNRIKKDGIDAGNRQAGHYDSDAIECQRSLIFSIVDRKLDEGGTFLVLA